MDNDEILLYKDVCAGRDNDSLNTREEYISFIKDNGLLELFNKVKYASLFDRFVEIFMYNANGLSICNEMDKLYSKRLKEAQELFDGEKEEECIKEIVKYRRLKLEYFNAMTYIEKQARFRLMENENKFYDIINDISKKVLDIDGDNNSKRK